MAGSNLDIVLSKQEKGPLDRFRNQNLLLKKFGEEGVAVYNLIDGESTAAQLLSKSGIKEDRFVEILEYMEANSIIAFETVEIVKEKTAKAKKPKEAKPKEEAAPEAPEEAGEEENAEEQVKKAKPAMKKPEKKAEKRPVKKVEEEEELTITPLGLPEAPAHEEEEEKPEEEIALEKEEAPVPEEEEEKPEEELAPEKEAPEEKEGEAAGIGAEEAAEDEEPEMPEEEEKIAAGPAKAQKKAAAAPDETESLSPLEKLIYDKYGKMGVQVYNLIDGEKTAEEILVETGISEVKLVEILEFMDSQGIIKLEKPADAGAPGAMPAPPEKPTVESEKFSPIAEETPETGEEGVSLDESGELIDIVPVDLPLRADMSVFDSTLLGPLLMSKFGTAGNGLFSLVDGKRDIIDLALQGGMSFGDIDNVLAFLGKRNAVLFRTLTREEIKRKYGSDGFAIYKKYGRDGLLLYQMIGKEPSLRDIIVKSRIEPERAVDIFMFIHKVLGLDLPIDRGLLYRQLGLGQK